MIAYRHFRAGNEEARILLTPEEQDPCRQHLTGASQPAKAHHELYPSLAAFLKKEFFFRKKGQKNTPLTWECKFNLCLHTRKAKGRCLAAQSRPSPQSSPSSGGWQFPGDRSRYGRPCSSCFARATATPGASHAELSTREAKAGSSRG